MTNEEKACQGLPLCQICGDRDAYMTSDAGPICHRQKCIDAVKAKRGCPSQPLIAEKFANLRPTVIDGVVMKRGLCYTCSQQPESEAPTSCICEWCSIRHYHKAWGIFDKALATISGMGGAASDIAVKARNEARNMNDCIQKEVPKCMPQCKACGAAGTNVMSNGYCYSDVSCKLRREAAAIKDS